MVKDYIKLNTKRINVEFKVGKVKKKTPTNSAWINLNTTLKGKKKWKEDWKRKKLHIT